MTNEEYIKEKFPENEKFIYILCPKDLSSRLNELEVCTGDCDDCWNLKIDFEV